MGVLRNKWANPLVFGIVYLLYHLVLITKSDLGLTPDGLAYLSVADSLNTALPFFVDGEFISHWPPLYPSFIALISLLAGTTSFIAAKVISAVTAFSVVYLYNLVLRNLKLDRYKIFLANVILFGCSGIGVIQLGLSEGIFMVFLLLLIYRFTNQVMTYKGHFFFVTGLLFGLLVLTRYAGLGFILGIGLVVLKEYKSLKKLVEMAIGFLIVSTPWLIYSRSYSDVTANREFAVHLISLKHLKGLAGSIYRFTNPSEILALAGLLFISAVVVIWINRDSLLVKAKSVNFNFLQKLLLSSASSYFFFLLISISFFDYKTPLNTRMLFPMFVLIILFLFSLEFNIRNSRIRMSGIIVTSLFMISHLLNFVTYSTDFANEGVGFTSNTWKSSQTLETTKKYYGRVIYSNASNVLKFYGIKGAVNLPLKLEPTSRRTNSKYKNEFIKMKKSTLNNSGAVVIFENKKWWDYLPSAIELSDNLSTNGEVNKLKDGIIYY